MAQVHSEYPKPMPFDDRVEAVKKLGEALEFIAFCGGVREARYWIEAASQTMGAYQSGDNK